MSDTTPIILTLLIEQPRDVVRSTTFNCCRVGFSSCGDKVSYEICDNLAELSPSDREAILRIIKRYRSSRKVN